MPGENPGIYHIRSIYGFGKQKEEFFSRPHSVVVDKEGYLYVADTNNHRLVIMDKMGRNLIRIIQNEGTGTGQMMYPLGIAVSDDGKILVCEKSLNKLMLFDRNGNLIKEIDIMLPLSAYFVDGKFYVTNYGKVLVYDDQLNKISEYGKRGPGKSEFDHPSGIVVKNSRIYVADAFNLRISVFDKRMNLIWSRGQKPKSLEDKNRIFGLPVSVAIDEKGYIYVLDAFNGEIHIFSQEGKRITTMGSMGIKDGEFNYPSWIFYSDGLFFIADKYNDRVQIVRIVPE